MGPANRVLLDVEPQGLRSGYGPERRITGRGYGPPTLAWHSRPSTAPTGPNVKAAGQGGEQEGASPQE